MNATLIVAFLRQRATSPMRMVLLFCAFVFPLLATLVTASLSPVGSSSAGLLALIFAAGLIGQDVSSGVLQLLFARPVTRPSYVFNRWLAAGGAAALVSLLQLLAGAALVALRHGDFSSRDLAQIAGENVLATFGGAAVITMFSSLLGGFGDLAVFFLLTVGSGIVEGLATLKHWTTLLRAIHEVQGFLNARLDLAVIGGQGSLSWFALASYASTVTLCLAVAVWAVNRKELSYASS